MCGRYTLIQTSELGKRFSVDEAEFDTLKAELQPRYNVAPEQIMPVVTEGDGVRHLELMQWGFMPAWTKSVRDIYKYNTFNARSEGVFEKPIWKRSAFLRRCLVPTSGFYEWRATSSGKQPYFIHLKRPALFAFAGLYRYWRGEDGSEVGTYAILTTEANRVMSVIHNRMPVILKRANEAAWLDSASPPGLLEELLRPYPDNALDIYAVSREVNAARADAATLVQPLNSR